MFTAIRSFQRLLILAIAVLLLAVPACRNDAGIIEEHERMLHEDEEEG